MDTVQDTKETQLPNEIGATSLQIHHREDFGENAGSQESHMNNKRMLDETDSPLDDVLHSTSEAILSSQGKKKKTQIGTDSGSSLTASFHQHENTLNSEYPRTVQLSPFQSNASTRNVLSTNQFVPYGTEHSSGLIIPTTTPNVPNTENQNATNVIHSPYPISSISSHDHEKTISSESASDSSSNHQNSLDGNQELHMRPPIGAHIPLSLPGNSFSFPLGSMLVNPSAAGNAPHPLHRPLDMPHSIPPFPQPPSQPSDFPVMSFHPNSPLELQYIQQRYMETLRDMMHNQSERSAPPKAPPKQPQTNPVFHSVYNTPFIPTNSNQTPPLPHPLSMLPNPNVTFSHPIPASSPPISNNNSIVQNNNNNSSSFSNAANSNSPNNRFVLLEQPNVRQRKSYKNENRYLLPNPLVVALRDDLTEKNFRISDGIASVRLVNADGDDLPSGKTNLLETADGGLCQNLDSSAAAHFSLKILETSDGAMFRLLITVQYNLESSPGAPPVPTEEKILSRPFQVFSNRKKNNKERPVVIDIKPSEAPCNAETEVWIKGKGFGDRVLVLFGDKPGRIIETAENLLTVLAPARFELSTDSTVVVAVSNKYPHDLLTAEKQLNFTYIAPHVNS